MKKTACSAVFVIVILIGILVEFLVVGLFIVKFIGLKISEQFFGKLFNLVRKII